MLCFVVQATEGGILAGSNNNSSANLSKGVILAGLCLQMVIIRFFAAVAAIWQMRISQYSAKEPKPKSLN